jgi:hypothetical protein
MFGLFAPSQQTVDEAVADSMRTGRRSYPYALGTFWIWPSTDGSRYRYFAFAWKAWLGVLALLIVCVWMIVAGRPR